MGETYTFVRPYPGRVGALIEDFLAAEGFEPMRNGVLPMGSSDDSAARFVMRARSTLVVLPFHVHRGPQGEVLDGVGALLALDDNADVTQLAMFMPVRSFSWGASFQRRLDILRSERPWVFERLLVAHEEELGTAMLAARLRRLVGSRDSDALPRTVRMPGLNSGQAGAWRFEGDSEFDSRDAGAQRSDTNARLDGLTAPGGDGGPRRADTVRWRAPRTASEEAISSWGISPPSERAPHDPELEQSAAADAELSFRQTTSPMRAPVLGQERGRQVGTSVRAGIGFYSTRPDPTSVRPAALQYDQADRRDGRPVGRRSLSERPGAARTETRQSGARPTNTPRANAQRASMQRSVGGAHDSVRTEPRVTEERSSGFRINNPQSPPSREDEQRAVSESLLSPTSEPASQPSGLKQAVPPLDLIPLAAGDDGYTPAQVQPPQAEESAVARFRRAAEIGARARRETDQRIRDRRDKD